MKKTVYIDSTIPSYYWDERPELRHFVDVTRAWWDRERRNYKMYISDYTIVELNQGNYPNKNRTIDLVLDIEQIEAVRELEAVASIYIKEFVMPKDAAGDAFHLACASYHKIDYILTWNCNHLANANKRDHILITNAKLGLFTPLIVTPLELFKEKE
jgi:predicted nucleic acid-binding protein